MLLLGKNWLRIGVIKFKLQKKGDMSILSLKVNVECLP